MGRPSVYDPEYHPKRLMELQEKGLTDVEIYADFGISKKSFYQWLREKEEFAEAYDLGSPKCEAVYIKKARECWERGDDKGFKYFISLMNNKFGWESGGKESKSNIQINQQINLIDQKSSTELIDLITKKIMYQNVVDVKPSDYQIEDKRSDEANE